MNLIKISDTVLVNADMISAIEMKNLKGGKTITLIVEGKSYISENKNIVADLIKAGVNLNEQYFAG